MTSTRSPLTPLQNTAQGRPRDTHLRVALTGARKQHARLAVDVGEIALRVKRLLRREQSERVLAPRRDQRVEVVPLVRLVIRAEAAAQLKQDVAHDDAPRQDAPAPVVEGVRAEKTAGSASLTTTSAIPRSRARAR